MSYIFLVFFLKKQDIKPKTDFEINRNVNLWQGRLIQILKEEVRIVMEKLRDEKVALEGKKELKIHIDPWDAYFFLDSTYFMRLLISKVNEDRSLIVDNK